MQDTAARAVENFFKPQNLTALRELALRRAAERIDADLIERMQAQAIEGPWAAGERILACIGPDPISPAVVRTAKRLADLMDAPWIAVTVERPGGHRRRGRAPARRRGDEARARPRRRERRRWSATTCRPSCCASRGSRTSPRSWSAARMAGFLRELLRRSLPHELVRRAEDIAIHLVTGGAERTRSAPAAARWLAGLSATPALCSRRRSPSWSRVGVGEVLTALTPIPNLSMVFLLAVLFTAHAASASGRRSMRRCCRSWPTISSSSSRSTPSPSPSRTNCWRWSIFLVVAVISLGAGRPRARAGADRCGRMRATRRLYEFTRRLSGLATLDAVAEGAASEIHASLGRPAVVLLATGRRSRAHRGLAAGGCARCRRDDGGALGLHPRRAGGRGHRDAADRAVVLRAAAHRARTARRRRHCRAKSGTAARFRGARAARHAGRADRGGARARVARARDGAAPTAAETERVRNTLLASVSHDFRTPLSSILGAATSLIEYGDKLDAGGPAAICSARSRTRPKASTRWCAICSRSRASTRARWNCGATGSTCAKSSSASSARRGGAGPHSSFTIAPAARPAAGARRRNAGRAGASAMSSAMRSPIRRTDTRVADRSRGPSGRASLLTHHRRRPRHCPRRAAAYLRQVRARDGTISADGGRAPASVLPSPRASWRRIGGSIAAESPVADGRGTRIMLTFPRADAAA